MNKRDEQRPPLVSIICTAYNHERYIRDCIEGFLMQKTNFPIEILIHDDASTDSTADIIREYETKYPHIIKPIYQTQNQYSQRVNILDLVLERAQGKYIAICEGDDFWIDPLKLQIQYDYMEDHDTCSLSVSNSMLLDEIHKTYTKTQPSKYWDKEKKPEQIRLDLLYHRTGVRTATCFYRREQFLLIREQYLRDSIITQCADYPLPFHLAALGEIKYFPQCFTTYRMHGNSFSSYTSPQKAHRLYFKIGRQYGKMAAANGYINLTKAIWANHNFKIYHYLIRHGLLLRARKFALIHGFHSSWIVILLFWAKLRLVDLCLAKRRYILGRCRYYNFQRIHDQCGAVIRNH